MGKSFRGGPSRREPGFSLSSPRGPRFVELVLDAALAECAETGFQALSVPSIAERAAVNKTSLYRRWPSKAEIIREAIERCMVAPAFLRPAGPVRDGLISLAQQILAFVESPAGGSMLKILLAEESGGLGGMAASLLRTSFEAGFRILLEAAIQSGELPANTDVSLLLCTIVGALIAKIYVDRGKPTSEYIERLVDLVLFGVSGRRAEVKPSRETRKVTGGDWNVVED
jgi:AcrR family transcriptional regulator